MGKRVFCLVLISFLLINLTSCLYENQLTEYFKEWEQEEKGDIVLEIRHNYVDIKNHRFNYNDNYIKNYGESIISPICVIDGYIYGIVYKYFEMEENSVFENGWILTRYNLKNDTVVEICFDYYSLRESDEDIIYPTTHYLDGNIYIFDDIQTTVYDVRTNSVQKNIEMHYEEVIGYKVITLEDSLKLVITKGAESRIFDFYSIASRNTYIEKLQQDVDSGDRRFSSKTKEKFINQVYIVDDDVYFDCWVYSSNMTDTVSILLYYDWDNDKFSILHIDFSSPFDSMHSYIHPVYFSNQDSQKN